MCKTPCAKARLDADRKATPLSKIVIHINPEKRVRGIVGSEQHPELELESGERLSLFEEKD